MNKPSTTTGTDWNALDNSSFRATVREFFETRYPKDLRYPKRRLRWAEIRDWYLTLSQKGWVAPSWPSSYGGMGLSPEKLIIFIEEQEAHGVARTPDQGVIMVGPLLIQQGNDEQKKRFLPKILSGEHVWCQGYSEPNSGSDLASLRTEAVLDGDDFVVNGQKTWSTLAQDGTHMFLLVRTDKTVRKQEGISFLLLDMKTPGITVRPIIGITLGHHLNEVFFDNVRVPAGNLFGGEGQAWKNIMKALGLERLGLAAISSGHCFRITEYARDYARDRIQFGQPISKFQVIQHKLADMLIMSETARQMTYRVADLLDAGQPVVTEASIAKIVATENNFKCADIGMQIMGGAGYSNEYDMQMFFRDSRVGPIGGGTSEIQRNILAKQMDL